jgi:hypothetical protein
MNESAARITLPATGLIMKIVGDVLIIETSDPDELSREVARAFGDESLTVQGAARYLKSQRERYETGSNPGWEPARFSDAQKGQKGPGRL